MAYEIYERIVVLQRLVTKYSEQFTNEELDEIRMHLQRARNVAGQAKA